MPLLATLSGGERAPKESQSSWAAIGGEVILSGSTQHGDYECTMSSHPYLPLINSICAWPKMEERRKTFWIVWTFYGISIWHWMKFEEDCPLNQAEFPSAFPLSISPSWASDQEWKICLFSTTRPQMKASCSEAEMNKEQLFFNYAKYLIPQDLCTCRFLCLGGFPKKISKWSTQLNSSLCLDIEVTFSMSSPLSL